MQRCERRSRRSDAADVAVLDELGRALDLVPPELEPELGRLVHGLEEQLVAVRAVLRLLLQREQLLGVEVTLVVAGCGAREDRLGEVLVRLGRHGGENTPA